MDGLDQVRVRVLPDGRVSRSDAAAFLGRKPKTLAMWALERRGPAIVRVGGRCFYRLEDLQRFVSGEAVQRHA
jgi:hypothetical protein